jgi:Fe2+ transport system protein FeoA
MSLTELNIGHEGRVVTLNVDQSTKHRLSGLGIIPGSYIKTIRSGWGIKLYEVKGALIALRDQDASCIYIK